MAPPSKRARVSGRPFGGVHAQSTPYSGPFSRLPTEIFLAILTSSAQQFSGNRVSAALHLASVCRFWMGMVFDFSALWDNITVHLDRAVPLDVLQTWLSRSRSRDLKLFLTASDPWLSGGWLSTPADGEDPSEASRLRGIPSLVLAELPRISNLRISSHAVDRLRNVPAFLAGIAPRLRQLYVEQERNNRVIDKTFMAPHLDTMELRGGCNIPSFVWEPTALPVLKSLTISIHDRPGSYIRVKQLFTTLIRLPELVELHLDIPSRHTPGFCCDGQHCLPALKHLTLENVDHRSARDFMRSISAPYLEELLWIKRETLPIDSITEPLVGNPSAFPRLQKLVLRAPLNMNRRCWRRLFKTTETFSEFEVQGEEGEVAHLLEGLRRTDDPYLILGARGMESVCVRCNVSPAWAIRFVSAMNKSRLHERQDGAVGIPAVLKRLHVQSATPLSDKERTKLENSVPEFQWTVARQDSGDKSQRAIFCRTL